MSQSLGEPQFVITRDGKPFYTLQLNQAPAGGDSAVVVDELAYCGFEIRNAEPGTEYAIAVGDIQIDVGGSPDDLIEEGLGERSGTTVRWPDATHWESARGDVWLALRSRPRLSDNGWRLRASARCYVIPTKLGEIRYQGMLQDLARLAGGLLFDLVSKSWRRLGLGELRLGLVGRSSHLELAILERIWGEVVPALRELEVSAVRALRRHREVRPCWGDRRLTPRTMTDFARLGVDPRRGGVQWPLMALEERLEEHTDTVEHRAIAGFLQLLLLRARWCRQTALEQARVIERDRRFRDQRVREGPTLYELEDVPRLRRLRQAADRAQRLGRSVERSRAMSFLEGIRPTLALPETPIFTHVAPYRRLFRAMFRYLRSSLFLLDTGTEERLKATSRMYEQWVFLQTLAALHHAGLRCGGTEGILRQVTADRFTLDIDRGAELIFESRDGRRLKVRYEPWILSRDEAQARGDSVYQGRARAAPWCPDVLIEVGAMTEGAEPKFVVEYAFVIDAKYTRRLRPAAWYETEKYAEIRSMTDRRQVVKQIWLAYPDVSVRILPRDPSVTWGTAGPDCSREDMIQGSIGLVPDEGRDEDVIELGELDHPIPIAQEFVNGMLRYLNVDTVLPDLTSSQT